MGPGRTAPSGLYVLPWTAYFFNADVSHLNFFDKCSAAAGQEAGHTCCALGLTCASMELMNLIGQKCEIIDLSWGMLFSVNAFHVLNATEGNCYSRVPD